MGREEKGKKEKQRKIERRQNQKDTTHIVQLNRSPPAALVRKTYKKQTAPQKNAQSCMCVCI